MYLVTGGAGFIGSNIVEELLKNNNIEVNATFTLVPKKKAKKKVSKKK